MLAANGNRNGTVGHRGIALREYPQCRERTDAYTCALGLRAQTPKYRSNTGDTTRAASADVAGPEGKGPDGYATDAASHPTIIFMIILFHSE
ncbi:hypothetical protein MTO96_051000 [Rhipicephalus appendiculatus]